MCTLIGALYIREEEGWWREQESIKSVLRPKIVSEISPPSPPPDLVCAGIPLNLEQAKILKYTVSTYKYINCILHEIKLNFQAEW
jgi:hypothetical protein